MSDFDYENINQRIDKYNRLRQKAIYNSKKNNNSFKILFFSGIVLVLIILIFFIAVFFKLINPNIDKYESIINNDTEVSESIEYEEENIEVETETVRETNFVSNEESQKIEEVINSYSNLGIIKSDGYINFRSEPNELDTRSIIGLMNNGAACDIIEYDLKNNSIYSKVKSGGMTGYVAKKFLITGEEAKKIARNDVRLRAIVLVDKLRMRSEPNISKDTEIGTTYKGERYICVENLGEWVKVIADNLDNYTVAFVNADPKYLKLELCLNEARTQDLKSDVINFYDNIGVSTAKDYVNIRKTANANGTIVGKLPGKAGCEIISTSGNFYKIKSGLVTGFVSKEYIATGKRAEDLAIQYADLRAIIKIAAMKVRKGPGTKYAQWTRVTKEETYIVTKQLDGWVEIEIDGTDDSKNGTSKGYVSTANNYIDVRYALDQAIVYSVSTPKGTSSIRTQIKNFAVKYIGGKYVWGGNNLSTGVDCSGFTQAVYKNFGVTLNRVSKEQAKQGVAVSSANKKVGDLVFYANSSGVIDHVAIYIGNNQIVHAASSKSGIKISNWNYRDYKAIRNVLGNK